MGRREKCGGTQQLGSEALASQLVRGAQCVVLNYLATLCCLPPPLLQLKAALVMSSRYCLLDDCAFCPSVLAHCRATLGLGFVLCRHIGAKLMPPVPGPSPTSGPAGLLGGSAECAGVRPACRGLVPVLGRSALLV